MPRPMVNVPEGPNEDNVYRRMNDEEYAVWKADRAAARKAEKEAAIHPLVRQLRDMSEEDKAAIREALS